MPSLQAQVDMIQMLLARLARISADSPWAYKASGLRGSLMRYLDALETSAAAATPPPSPEQLNALLTYGFEILEKVAQTTAPKVDG